MATASAPSAIRLGPRPLALDPAAYDRSCTWPISLRFPGLLPAPPGRWRRGGEMLCDREGRRRCGGSASIPSITTQFGAGFGGQLHITSYTRALPAMT